MTDVDDPTGRLAAIVARRVASRGRDAPLDALLADVIPGNELTTLLLHAHRRRARKRRFVDVLRHLERSPLTHPNDLDGRLLRRLEDAAFAAAAGFDVVDLAPVLPLGAVAATGIDPNNVLTTLRFCEVAADPAVSLALAVAAARRSGARGELRRAATVRCVRLQPPTHAAHRPHFRMCALATAIIGDDAADRRALLEQLSCWLRCFAGLGSLAPRARRVTVAVSDTRLVKAWLRHHGVDVAGDGVRAGAVDADALRARGLAIPDHIDDVRDTPLRGADAALAAALHDELIAPLRAASPDVVVVADRLRLQGLAYYRGPFVQITVERDDGTIVNLGDGGAVGWLQELLGQKRERFVATGVGIELLARLFQRDTTATSPVTQAASVVLRALTDDDADALAGQANDIDVARFLRERFPHPYLPEHARAFVAHARAVAPPTSHRAIVVDGAVVGCLSLEGGADVHRGTLELGIWLGRDGRHRGIGARIVDDAVREALALPGVERVEAVVYADNAACLRMLEKAGFVREGVQRRHATRRGAVIDTVLLARVRP